MGIILNPQLSGVVLVERVRGELILLFFHLSPIRNLRWFRGRSGSRKERVECERVVVYEGCLRDEALDFIGQFWPNLFGSGIFIPNEDMWGNGKDRHWGVQQSFDGVFPLDYGGAGVGDLVVNELIDVDDDVVVVGRRHVLR